jgi:hypothetical protein
MNELLDSLRSSKNVPLLLRILEVAEDLLGLVPREKLQNVLSSTEINFFVNA